MQYVIVGAEDAKVLDQLVNNAIADGWEPQGGVACCAVFQTWENSRKGHTESETMYTWAQAMVKRS